MILRFNIFGFEVARIELDLGDYAQREITPLDKGIKSMTRFWVKRMNK